MSAYYYPEGPSRRELASREGVGRLTVAVQQRVGPYISRALRDPHAAEDVLQETLLVMVERVGGLQRTESFWPWIYRVARRKIQDHFRRQHRWALVAETVHGDTRRRVATAGAETDALEVMIASEDTRELSAAIGQMNGCQRRIINLRCFEQLPYTEIAQRTRTSPAQVRTSFHRAKTLLRKRLCALSA